MKAFVSWSGGKEIKLLEVKKIQTGGRCLLDILKYSLGAK